VDGKAQLPWLLAISACCLRERGTGLDFHETNAHDAVCD
jgi:hypothetical protein